MRLQRSALAAVPLLAATIFSSHASYAQSLGANIDLLGVSSAAKDLRETAERTMIQLQSLERVANYDVEQRLEQLRSIVKDALDGTQASIELASRRASDLEAKINKDAVDLLYRAQCTLETALMDQVQRSLAKIVADIRQAQPGVKIFGITFLSASVQDIKIDDPNAAYFSAKKLALDNLQTSINETSKAYTIFATYQSLEKLANSTRCIYIDQSAATIFTREINEWERLSVPWINVVQADP
jgi:hypothetical protein